MKTAIARCVRRLLGRAYEVRLPPPRALTAWVSHAGEEQRRSSGTLSQTTEWDLIDIRLKPGWYMLEVEHALDSIGCVLTLHIGKAQQEYLLLTSKPVCKRIVWLHSALNACTISIDQPDCSLERLSLVALSSAFATSRMSSRLVNRGASNDAVSREAASLYAEYRSHVQNAVLSNPYIAETSCSLREAIASVTTGTDTNTDSDLSTTGSLLVLHSHHKVGEAAASASLKAAVAFARRVGWKIAWQPDSEFRCYHEADLSGKRIFHMRVVHGVEFRVDVFHHMMINISGDSALIYADHDYIDEDGVRSEPALKPEWNPELLLNTNYIQVPWMISDAWIVRLKNVGGKVFEESEQILLSAAIGVGAMPHELLLALRDEQVIRIPRVLASLPVQQSVSDVNAMQPWHEHVRRTLSAAGCAATVASGLHAGLCHVRWSLPIQMPSVDIIIPTRDKVDVLKACIDSILEHSTYANYRIMIVDNDSQLSETQNYYRLLGEVSCISILSYAGEFNYSAINNYAVSHSNADVVVLLNNDTEVISPAWLEELVGQAMRPDIGCVGAKLYYSNGRIQHGGVIVGIAGVAGHAHRYSPSHARGYCDRLIASQNMTAVTAACLAVRREIYIEAGGLDDDKLRVAWNDVDFCLKVRKLGYRNVWTPFAELFHHEGLSRGADDSRSKIRRVDAERHVMRDRWSLDRFNDPAYHPLLTRDNERFGLA